MSEVEPIRGSVRAGASLSADPSSVSSCSGPNFGSSVSAGASLCAGPRFSQRLYEARRRSEVQSVPVRPIRGSVRAGAKLGTGLSLPRVSVPVRGSINAGASFMCMSEGLSAPVRAYVPGFSQRRCESRYRPESGRRPESGPQPGPWAGPSMPEIDIMIAGMLNIRDFILPACTAVEMLAGVLLGR